MLGFFTVITLSAFFSENPKEGFKNIDPRLPLLYFPLSIGLISIDKSKRDRILLGIAVVITIACTACLIYALYRYRSTGNAALLYNDSFSELIGQQSIYTSLLLNISIYIYGYFIFYTSTSTNTKLLMSLAIIVLFGCGYMLASRNMMVLIYSITVLFIFYYTIKRKKHLEGITFLIGLLLIGFLVFKFFPKTLNRFKELTFTQYNYQHIGKESHYNMEVTADQWNGANFRLAAWPCGWELFIQHPITGVGLGDKKEALFAIYKQKQFHFALDTKKNVHNNYLDILLSMGIIGLLFYALGWLVCPVIAFFKSKDSLALLILITIAIAMITENYFDRSLGGMLVGFFIPFLLTSSTPPKNKKESN